MNGLLHVLGSAPPARVLFVGEDRGVTAGEVRSAARRAMARVEPGDGPVFLHTDSAALLAAGLLAGAALGRRIAILPHALPAYLQEVGANAGSFLSDRGDSAALMLEAAAGDNAAFDFAPDADAELIFFTSGSTGAPKQAPKRLSQIDAEAVYWAGWFADRADHVAGTVSHQHIYGLLFRVALPVLAGWRSSDRQAFGWEAFAADLGPRSVAVSSPAHLTRMPPALRFPNGAPGFVLSSGQALPLTGALEASEACGAPPIEILGSTETGGVAMRQRRDDDEPWTPLGGVRLALSPEGVLLVESPFSGGEAQPMGDHAQMLPDGRFRLLARTDRVVKVEGKRVSLARVEEALGALEGVAEAAVVGLSENGGEALGAVIVLTPEGGTELAAMGAFRFTRGLRRLLSARLEPAERPKSWRFVGRVPVNAQGKRVAGDLARLFDTPSLIGMLDTQVLVLDELTVEARFVLAPELVWFKGHFPGRPVLPGVAQVHIAARLGEEIWGFSPGSFGVSRMKFRRLMTPGDSVVLTLTRDVARRRLAFAFAANGEAASDGVVG
ncbi:MAG: AMP-dependent synthetase [Alphaproteobacteria bacterium]|nr:AMP-dependent synthetase [Alphaproteobacteria bacterium]